MVIPLQFILPVMKAENSCGLTDFILVLITQGTRNDESKSNISPSISVDNPTHAVHVAALGAGSFGMLSAVRASKFCRSLYLSPLVTKLVSEIPPIHWKLLCSPLRSNFGFVHVFLPRR